MKLIKKKTQKAIKKSVAKAIRKHGPEVASHLAASLAAGITALVAAEPKKAKKQLKKIAKSPTAKRIGKAVNPVPLLSDVSDRLGGNNHKARKSGQRTLKAVRRKKKPAHH
jgi:hypothetical protein